MRDPVDTGPNRDGGRFVTLTELEATAPTLIEGLPGHGLVASIAVETITEQLELSHHGTIHAESFPSVLSFEDGRTRDPVRVYGGDDPPVLTLQSDVAIPPSAFDVLARVVMRDLAQEFGRAIFLAGAPAEAEDQIGEVVGVATTETLESELEAANIDLAQGSGIVGGVTGALAGACHEVGVPAAVLIVRANPYLPDPAAARAVIETALEPLVEFDVDTTELERQADEIRSRKQQIAQQLKQQASGEEPGQTRMFQ